MNVNCKLLEFFQVQDSIVPKTELDLDILMNLCIKEVDPQHASFGLPKIVKNKELYRRNLSHPFSSLP
jgi:D-mannonate dehydratase